MNERYNKIKYFEETEKVHAEVYYHYTSLNALYEIVKSKCFRLTSLKSSNDKKELYYKPEQFLNDFFKGCNEKSYPYALCLSEKKDNLTHWDRYAIGCKGVCIGFNISALKIFLQRMNSVAYGIGLYDVGKVFYSGAEREIYIRNGLIRLYNLFYEYETQKDSEIEKIAKKNGYIYATSICGQLRKFVKNSSFIDEDEVRLYHDAASIKSTLRLIDTMEPEIDAILYGNLRKNFYEVVEKWGLEKEEFCVTGSGIRSYRNLCLKDIWGSGTIPEIILGPMCVQNVNELKRFLKANGLEGTKVTVSKVPIR